MDLIETTLKELSDLNGLHFSDAVTKSILLYYGLLCKWAQKINITANLEERKFVIENVLDPVLAFRTFCHHDGPSHNTPGHTIPLESYLKIASGGLADVGCGGGFVGLVWQILRRDLFKNSHTDMLSLIDGDRKKINFCKDVIRTLPLDRCTAECNRAELITNHLADIVVTRATWNDSKNNSKNVALEQCRGIAKPGAYFIHLTGKADSENHNSPGVFCNYQIHPDNICRQILIQKF